MKRVLAIGLMAFSLTGCAGIAAMIAGNATVVSIVDGVRAGCGWELASSDVQALMNSGIPGLSTTQSYIGAFCSAVVNLPVASVRSGAPQTVMVGGVSMRATRSVK